MTQASDQVLDLQCINTLRTLAIDQVQKANSGHPGTPMGAALVALTAGAGTVADSEPPPVAKQAGITKEQWQADAKKYGRG